MAFPPHTHVTVCVCSPSQVVCMWLPPAAAEALEGTVQPRAAGSRVHGADADSRLSRHVCIFFLKLPDKYKSIIHSLFTS